MSTYNEEGLYRGTIVRAAVTEARNAKKTPQVELHIDLIGMYGSGETDADELYRCEKPRYNPVVYLYITDNTMGTPSQPGWVAETLAALGFTGNFDELARIEGNETDLVCAHEEYQGKQRERWSILRVGSRSGQQPQQTLTRALTARFSQMFKAPVNPV